MKQNIKFTLYIFIILVLLQFGQGAILKVITGLSQWLIGSFGNIMTYLKIFLILFWILGITYTFWKKPFRQSVAFRIAILLLIPAIMYGWSLRMQMLPMYNLAKERGEKVGKVYVNDDRLGYKHLPNSIGYRLLGFRDIVVFHDENGNRIPQGYKHNKKRPLVLYLGCSVSYGDAVFADSTFAYHLSQKLGGDYINAATSGYGLSQMVLKAEELIPKLKPDYVVTQYTTWLAHRSMSPYQNFLGGTFPIPYFSNEGLELPAFSPRGLRIPLADFKHTPRNPWDFSKFYARVAPTLIYQDVMELTTKAKMLVGITPRPTNDALKAEQYGYGRIADVCKQNGSQMYIWTSGTGWGYETKLPPSLVYERNIPIIHADTALIKKYNLKEGDTYGRLYGHWYKPNGKDSVMADGHPNPHAHEIIADEMYRVITGRSTTPTDSTALANLKVKKANKDV
ncbi:hypothetical protein [Telluribacter sp.]|jgi:hypothetical protein|uniref:SGNH/GDSL hydrolase family protein n=1 Tax=Telluribacter sp. TaxID=1978767 RepID=UPI002E15D7D7|nr:hypothetical protein [Telluribacter sp.]